VVGQVVALLIVVLGWYGAAGQTAGDRQSGWLALAVGGLVTSGAVNGWWLRTWRVAMGRARAELVAAAHGSPAPSARPDSDGARVVVEGGALIHRAGCPLVGGKAVTPVGEGSDDLAACGVCRP
jgi:hypothetical protein